MTKIKFLTPLVFLFTLFTHSQSFKKGYYIKSGSTEPIEILIKDENWKFSPEDILIRNTVKASGKKLSTSNVQEFGIADLAKFERHAVEIDYIPDLESTSSEITLTRAHLLLEVLVEGNISLFKYENRNIRRFFYQIENQPLKQLLYKKYHYTKAVNGLAVNRLKENTGYVLQLHQDVKCQDIEIENEIPKFEEKELIDYFIRQNICSFGEEAINFARKKEKNKVNVSIIGGIHQSQLTAVRSGFGNQVNTAEYDSGYNFSIGLSAENVLPSRKVSFLVEGSYHTSYTASADVFRTQVLQPGETESIEMSYSYVRGLVGLRYHFLTGEKSSLFLSGNYHFNFFADGEVYNHPDFGIDSRDPDDQFADFKGSYSNFSIGLGYRWDKLTVELRNETKTDPFANTMLGEFKRISFYCGYAIF